jgi:hypothetical protein
LVLHRVTQFAFSDIKQKSALSLYDACQVEIPRMPDVVTSDSYDSVELNAELLHLGIESNSNQEIGDGPPSKRRKVHEPKDTFDEVVSGLYSLLGAQKVADLAGLSQLAE